jgi:N-succinyldiaminopimelate aminotransferase
MEVAERMHGLPRIGLDIMGEQADEKGQSYRLENADSDIPPPEVVVRATREAVGLDEYNSWLPLTGLRELRRAVTERISEEDGLGYDWQTEVVVTNGVQEGLLSVLLALLDPGDGVVTPEPAYSGIINRIRLAHGVPQFFPLREELGWRLDLDALDRAVDGSTKAIVFNATNMPTGMLYTREELDAIADLAAANDLWVVYSATSSRTAYEVDRAFSIATWPGMRERTIIVDGLSKDFNLTAWRIGWAVGPVPVMEHVGKAHMYNGTLTGGFQQAGLVALLSDPETLAADRARRVEILRERRDVVVEGINAIPGLSCVRPGGGWWLLVDHREVEEDDSRFAQMLLDEVNVAVTPMHTWGPNTAGGHIRIIYSNEPVERLREAMGKIAEVVSSG